MTGFLIGLIAVVHVTVCIALMSAILLQSGKGGGLAGAFGAGSSQTLFGGRGAASFLSRATTVLAVVFFLTSLTLGLHASRSGARSSLIQQEAGRRAPVSGGASPPATAPQQAPQPAGPQAPAARPTATPAPGGRATSGPAAPKAPATPAPTTEQAPAGTQTPPATSNPSPAAPSTTEPPPSENGGTETPSSGGQ